LAALETRFNRNRRLFDVLAALAEFNDVFLGCSCPTKKNPRLDHCHTYLALEFMGEKYPSVEIALPVPF
jgi:hypothetical protein